MDEVERDFYESLYMLTRAKFDGYVKKGSVLHNYAHIPSSSATAANVRSPLPRRALKVPRHRRRR